jgi:hypothetical protein
MNPEVGQTAQELAGECSSTAGCQQLYDGATDCRNSEGGVCYCGNAVCGLEDEPPAIEGPFNQCAETSDCESAYPGNDVSHCNQSNGVCRCFDASGGKVRCFDQDEPTAPQPVGVTIPARIEAESFVGFFDSTDAHNGNCGSGPVDAQTTADEGGGCNVGWTTAGEWLEYEVNSTSSSRVALNLRLAANAAGKRVEVHLDGSPIGVVTVPANGWQSFSTMSINDVAIDAGNHVVRVAFVDGGINFNWLEFGDGTAEPPAPNCNDGLQNQGESGVDCGGPCTPCSETPGDVHVFQRVPGPSNYPAGIRTSTRYRVLAKAASDPTPWNRSLHETATYDAWPDYDHVPHDLTSNHVHFAQIDADERVRFRVEVLTETVDTVRLKPSRYGLNPNTTSNAVEFAITPGDLTKHVLVEVNDPQNGQLLNHGLMVFVNPPSEMPAGNVLVLPSGVLDRSSPYIDQYDRLFIPSGSAYDAIYIPEDTIVDGRIHIKKNGFTVAGRGMVIGSRFPWPKADPNWQNRYPITPDGERVKGIIEENASGGTFRGVMTVHPYHFNFVGGDTVENVKAFGWRHSTDGIHGVDEVRGVFIRTNDDHIYFPSRIIEDSSFWALTNGSVFQGGWGGSGGTSGTRSGGHAVRCNILRGEWNGDGGARQNNGIFGSVDRSTSQVRGYLFEDIIIEGPTCRMLNFEMACGGNCNRGTWKDLTFRNIDFEHEFQCPNGNGLPNLMTTDGRIENLTFDDVRVGGQLVSSWADLNPHEKKNVYGVRFNP